MVRSPVKVPITPAGQPCAFAWRPATIVLPENFCASSDSQKLRWALAHEWSHVSRGDVWSWSLAGIVRWFCFYQPLLWFLKRQLQLCQDYVADAEAVRVGTLPEDYAEFLTSRASQFSQTQLAAGLGIGGRSSDLTRRVLMLVENKRPLESASPRKWNLAVLPIAIVVLITVGALRAQPAKVVAQEKANTVYEPRLGPRPGTTTTEPKVDTLPETNSAEPNYETSRATAIATSEPKDDVLEAVDPADAKPAVKPARTPSNRQPPKLAGQANVPRRVRPGDILTIEVISNFEAGLLLRPNMAAIIDSDGKLSLGAKYGTVLVGGKTLVEIERLIGTQLSLYTSQSLSTLQKRAAGQAERGVPTDAKLPDKVEVNVRVSCTGHEPGVEETVRQTAQQVMPGPSVGPQEETNSQEPRLIAAGDLLNIEITGIAPNPLDIPAIVEPGGSVPMGARFGRVNVKGKTVEAAEQVIKEHITKTNNNPLIVVQVTWRAHAPQSATVSPYIDARPVGPQDEDEKPPVALKPRRLRPGDILMIEVEGANEPMRFEQIVEPVGNIAMGVRYGRVNVLGQTLEGAEEAIKKHLREVLKDPQVQVTYVGRASDDDPVAIQKLDREISELKKTIRELQGAKPWRK